jgi:hypothetical protein
MRTVPDRFRPSRPKATLAVIPGSKGREMFTVRPEDYSAEQTAAAMAALTDPDHAAIDVTPTSRMATLTGRPSTSYWVLVPSASRPGQWWEMRVSWHAGYVETGHYGHGCEASEVNRRCWHGLTAALVIARTYHRGVIPAASVPVRNATVPTTSEPERARLTAGDRGFYS